MARHNNLGHEGEQLAVEYLRENGYTILERNWRYSKVEIDIIAREKDAVILFIEVKTRSNDKYGHPEEAVNVKKQMNLLEAANAYLEENELDDEIRFDIISIILDQGHVEDIHHIKDAILPYQ